MVCDLFQAMEELRAETAVEELAYLSAVRLDILGCTRRVVAAEVADPGALTTPIPVTQG
jgi:hypothetical protein